MSTITIELSDEVVPSAISPEEFARAAAGGGDLLVQPGPDLSGQRVADRGDGSAEFHARLGPSWRERHPGERSGTQGGGRESRVPGTPYLIESNHFADGQGKQGHGVSPRAKGATHVSLVPESGWPLPRRGEFIGPKDAQVRLLAQGRTGSQSSGRGSRSGPHRS